MSGRTSNATSRTGVAYRIKPIVLAITCVTTVTNVAAQSQSAGPSSKEVATELPLVVVTSSKRTQLQSDVAGTVSVVSGAQLERLGSVDAEDVIKLTPGVQFNKGSGEGALLSIRGVGTNGNAGNQGFTQAPTGIYIEDVPFTDAFAFVSTPDIAPFDLERVEVLRGPQGALYGSSSLGGAIRYLVNKPNTKVTEGSVLAGFTSVAHGGTGWNTAAMANVPLADGKAGLRVVVSSRKDAGFIDNVGTGQKDANTSRVDSGRILFTYRPSQDFDITAMFLTQHTKQADGSGISPFNAKTGSGYVKSFELLEVNTLQPQTFDSRVDLGTLQANWNVGGYRLTSLTGHQKKKRVLKEDFSRDFYDPAFKGDVWTSEMNPHSQTTTQEFRIAPVSPGDVNWLLGAFWMDGEIKRDQKVFLEPRGAQADLRFRRFGKASETSVFADAEVKLTPALTAAAGVRFYKTKLSYDRIVGAEDAGTSTLPYASDDSGNTPKVSLRYMLDSTSSVYILASRGYRFGGISNLGTNPVGRPYKSDSLINYEAGWRWAPSRAASLDVSVFSIDWKDLQLAELYLDPNSGRKFTVTGNVGKAKSQGLEVAGEWRPSHVWSLRGTVAYTDAVTDAGVSTGGTPVTKGTSLPGTAKVQASLEATTYFGGPMGSSGRFSTVLSHTGKRNAQLDSDIKLPAYSTADLRLAFSWDALEVAAFINNVTDARGISAAVDYGSSTYSEFYPIRPRNVGVTVRYDF